MEAPRTHMFSSVQNGGYIVPRPPNPPNSRIPPDSTLREIREADARIRAEFYGAAAPEQRPDPPAPAVRRAASADAASG
eukprot:3460626-Alexandrium_andersonii.AAC.1